MFTNNYKPLQLLHISDLPSSVQGKAWLCNLALWIRPQPISASLDYREL